MPNNHIERNWFRLWIGVSILPKKTSFP